jgi:hypothetical protein
MRTRFARDRLATSSHSISYESDGLRDVDDFVPRYHTRSQTIHPRLPINIDTRATRLLERQRSIAG